MKELVHPLFKAFQQQSMDYFPRGELWIGTKVLNGAKLEDNVEGHLEIRKSMGMDLIFFPLAPIPLPESDFSYRYFSIEQVTEARKLTRGFLGVVIDGPFQRVVNKLGLINFLSNFSRDKNYIAGILEKEATIVRGLINDCLELNVQAVVVADDFAWEKGTYLHPKDIKNFMFSIYSEVVNRVHETGSLALFHSCGAISKIVPILITCGFDGLAGCQSECLDLVAFKRDYGKILTMLTGIEGNFFQTESLSSSQEQRFIRNLKILGQGGGLILCSSCGLHSPNNLDRLRTLYQLANKTFFS